jgi:hypothetical protein
LVERWVASAALSEAWQAASEGSEASVGSLGSVAAVLVGLAEPAVVSAALVEQAGSAVVAWAG